MRGTVTRSGTGWQYVVDLGRDPVTGKRRQVRKRGFRRQGDAEGALTDALAEMRRGEFVRRTKGTLAEYLTGWLEARSVDLRPTTGYGYRKVVEARIIPGIGQVRLCEIDTALLESGTRSW